MPRIFDNLMADSRLLPALQETLDLSSRADFCVGYLNLRGWGGLASHIDRWGDDKGPCRVLVGMQRPPHAELHEKMSLAERPPGTDHRTANRTRQELVGQFARQLAMGAPTNTDENTLRQLSAQLRSGKVIVKLFLRHPLHAKLYLLYRDDPINPIVGYLGSSNLTFSGLVSQGELNLDVLDRNATLDLKRWFEERWNDGLCLDITGELARIIDKSWARQTPIPPYHIYLKMAYHLSHEARAGLAEYKIPAVFGDRLFDFQAAAVKIAAHHIYKRGGVLIGDVVGLGKTLMATAVARIFEDDYGLETLIISPKNLVCMWEGYAHEYGLRAKVISLGMVLSELPRLRRYRLVIIDESHNLRNRQGKRYREIRDYVRANDSKCILLSATPYNKTYHDLSSQLRIFVDDDQNLGIRPERLLREVGEAEFGQQHQASPQTLAAFDLSPHIDDWRDLMSHYMVRRTRSFIQNNYARTDPDTGRKFLTYENGDKSFFPVRVPKTARFAINDSDPKDQYAGLYSPRVVDIINQLKLPRYGLGNYVSGSIRRPLTADEKDQIQNLSRAGPRLTGVCRTNLFKRLESSGAAFLLSIERHLLRNHIFLHAIRNGLPLPIGTQDASMLDNTDGDDVPPDWQEDGPETMPDDTGIDRTPGGLERRAAQIYGEYREMYRRRFRWLAPDIFADSLESDLQRDSHTVSNILRDHGDWRPERDAKLNALHSLLTETWPDRKVLVFTQFADTALYVREQLVSRGLDGVASVTGDTENPAHIARRFSPSSNPAPNVTPPSDALRIVISTDVLSEGHNLQDCHIVVNYDLPWAIIRLIQRAGRVDRIGQDSGEILCVSFLPADGVDRIIDLRGRVRRRLEQNAEVVGTDEVFFEDEADRQTILDLYNERAHILDGDADGEVDLASHAYQIWKNAVGADSKLEEVVTALPDVAFSSRRHSPTPLLPEGVLIFVRTAGGNNSLAYVDRKGRSVTESQLEILAAAKCGPNTPARPRHETHHRLVESGARHIAREERRAGGQLGRPSGARSRAYGRLKAYAGTVSGHLPDADKLRRAIDDIYRHPLRRAAEDALNRHLRYVDDAALAELVISMRDRGELCLDEDQDAESQEPGIICSLGLFDEPGGS